MHGDIKPENILIKPTEQLLKQGKKFVFDDNCVKIADFGISKQAPDGTYSVSMITMTQFYGAPEAWDVDAGRLVGLTNT